MSFFAYCKNLTPPTAVQNCVKSNFTDESETNLIISKSNLLEVYLVKNDQEKGEQLYLQNIFELNGNIESICPVKFPENKRDSLLMSFKEGKVSCVDFDIETNDLKTICLHYLEDDFLKEGCLVFSSKPTIKLEPRKRCAALLIYDFKLVILPFKQDTLEIELGKQKKEKEVPIMKQMIIDLKEIGLQNIKDYCFLHGYYEPTLLILHETEKTCSSRILLKSNTCTVTAISLDVVRGHYPVIWTVKNLPNEAYQLIPLSDPFGGALVLSYDSILHVNQRLTYGISFNDFIKYSESNLPITLDKSEEALSLDANSYTFLSKERILLSIENDLYVLNLSMENRVLNKMILKKVSTQIESSCMCLFSENLLFLGSILTNSKVLKIKETNKNEEIEKEIKKEEPEQKKRKIENEDFSESLDYLKQLEEEEEENEDDEKNLFKESISEKKLLEYEYEFQNIDSFLNFGPISSFTVVESPNTSNDQLELVGCSGYGSNGSLNFLKRSIEPEEVIKIDVKDVKQLFTLKYNDTKLPNFKHLNDSYLIMSLSNSTQIYKISEGLSPLKSSDFILKERTLNASNILNGRYSVQICLSKIRILEKEKLKFEKELTNEIHFSSILDPFILLLYNDGTINLFEITKKSINSIDVKLSKGFGRITSSSLFKENDETYLIVTWSSGAFEIYNLNTLSLSFINLKYTVNSQSIRNEIESKNISSEKEEFSSLKEKVVIYPYVKEVLIKEFKNVQHLMFLMSDDSLSVYRKSSKISNFSKINIDYKYKNLESDRILELESTKLFSDTPLHQNLISCNSIGGKECVIICGEQSCLLFDERSYIRSHLLNIKGNLIAFAPFQNATIKQGFTYFSDKELFKISTLKKDINYDTYWPTKRIELDCTPHQIAFHKTKKTFCLSTSTRIPLDLTEEPEPLPEVGRFPIPFEDKFEIKLLNGLTYKEMSHIELEKHEHTMIMKVCKFQVLEDDETRSNFSSYLVVGTAFVQNEDISCRGRVLVFDLEAKGTSKRVLSLVAHKDMKGPVTAITELDGYLSVASGGRIFVFYLDLSNSSLNPAAFFDSQFYCTSLISIKRYLVFGDRYKSVQLLNWKKNRGNTLSFLSRDYNPLKVSATGFLVHEGQLGILVADGNNNIQVFTFSPNSSESLGGKSLVAQSDFNVGGNIRDFFRLKIDEKCESQLSVFGKSDGSFGVITPISEKDHRILSMLQSRMYTQLHHTAGLHPKAFRLFKPETHSLHNPKRNIIDGELLNRYENLDPANQTDLSQQIGMKVKPILKKLLNIENAINKF